MSARVIGLDPERQREAGRPRPLPSMRRVERVRGVGSGGRDAPRQGHVARHERRGIGQVAPREPLVEQLQQRRREPVARDPAEGLGVGPAGGPRCVAHRRQPIGVCRHVHHDGWTLSDEVDQSRAGRHEHRVHPGRTQVVVASTRRQDHHGPRGRV